MRGSLGSGGGGRGGDGVVVLSWGRRRGAEGVLGRERKTGEGEGRWEERKQGEDEKEERRKEGREEGREEGRGENVVGQERNEDSLVWGGIIVPINVSEYTSSSPSLHPSIHPSINFISIHLQEVPET